MYIQLINITINVVATMGLVWIHWNIQVDCKFPSLVSQAERARLSIFSINTLNFVITFRALRGTSTELHALFTQNQQLCTLTLLSVLCAMQHCSHVRKMCTSWAHNYQSQVENCLVILSPMVQILLQNVIVRTRVILGQVFHCVWVWNAVPTYFCLVAINQKSRNRSDPTRLHKPNLLIIATYKSW